MTRYGLGDGTAVCCTKETLTKNARLANRLSDSDTNENEYKF
jgi:hypothetical protein